MVQVSNLGLYGCQLWFELHFKFDFEIVHLGQGQKFLSYAPLCKLIYLCSKFQFLNSYGVEVMVWAFFFNLTLRWNKWVQDFSNTRLNSSPQFINILQLFLHIFVLYYIVQVTLVTPECRKGFITIITL